MIPEIIRALIHVSSPHISHHQKPNKNPRCSSSQVCSSPPQRSRPTVSYSYPYIIPPNTIA